MPTPHSWKSSSLYCLGLFAAATLGLGGFAFCQAPKSDADSVSIPQLFENLDSDNVRVAAATARTLGVVFSPGGRKGADLDAAAKRLMERLASPKGAELRRECAVALGRMRAVAAVEPLKKAMTDEDVDVAMAAGAAVARILPVDEARKFLITRGGENAEKLEQAAAYHGLSPIAKPEDAPFLLQGLSAENWRTQMAAVTGLERAVRAGARLKPEDYDAVAAVLGAEMLNASGAAVHFFRHVRNDEAFRAVLKAAETRGDDGPDDVTWRARTQALRTIHYLGWPRAEKALPVVIRNLGDRTVNVNNEARRILYALRKENRLSQGELFALLLAELEKAGPLKLRAGIMREMTGPVDRPFASRVAKVAADTLQQAMQEKSQWPARAYSLSLLSASGYTGVMDAIARCVSDDVPNVRQAAGQSLEQLSPLCPTEQRVKVAPLLQPLLEQPVDWRKTAIAARAVGHYANTETIKPLSELLRHSVLNVRQAASHALVTVVRRKDAQLRPRVEEAVYAELEKSPRTWEHGAPVLGALQDRRAIGQLTEILNRGDWRSQASAAGAVAAIAKSNQINDKPLSDALIKAAQSEVVQVQQAANAALRELTRSRKKRGEPKTPD